MRPDTNDGTYPLEDVYTDLKDLQGRTGNAAFRHFEFQYPPELAEHRFILFFEIFDYIKKHEGKLSQCRREHVIGAVWEHYMRRDDDDWKDGEPMVSSVLWWISEMEAESGEE